MNAGLRRSCERVARSITSEMEHNFKHVSFICNRNSIVSVGWNHPHKSHPLAHKYGYRFNSIHSELHAILNFELVLKELRHHKLVNVRLDRWGHMRLSRPCRICQVVLIAFGIQEIWYTDRNGNWEQQ